jgi:hypothetical protein
MLQASIGAESVSLHLAALRFRATNGKAGRFLRRPAFAVK